MQKSLRIISRNSVLAMWQANYVADKINQLYPDIKIDIKGTTTEGDRFLDHSLDKIGGKGLFIKELEQALLRNEADIAVHSLKDLPANLAAEFTLAAFLEREDAGDALVANNYTTLASMPNDSIIGTSSIRRRALLNKYYPHLRVKLLRGNVITRLKKLDAGEYDGIILAVAGLKRLDLAARITEYLAKDIFVPAIAQGVLAVEVLADNFKLNQLMNQLTDKTTEFRVNTERELGRILKASCSVPIAAYATISEDMLKLHAIILDNETGQYCCSVISGIKEDYQSIASNCAAELLAQGAATILHKYA